jgi:hypothetical protein
MQEPSCSTPKALNSDFPGFFDLLENSSDGVTRQDVSPDPTDMSVSEAASLLGITERSVWRRIKLKKLTARLENGRTVVRLRQTDLPPDTSVPIEEITVDSSIAVSHPSEEQHEFAVLAVMKELACKLEGATFRNGFLEAQLEAAASQLKLLPDLQRQVSELEHLRAENLRLSAELARNKPRSWRRFIDWISRSST